MLSPDQQPTPRTAPPVPPTPLRSAPDGPRAGALPAGPTVLHVAPWADDVVERHGHDPRSPYVERFWLGVLGPSCIFLARHLAARLEGEPAGFDLDVVECARALGLGSGVGRHAPLTRTVTRLCQFGMAQRFRRDGLAVRRAFPPLARHHLLRLPALLQAAHDDVVTAARPDRHPDVA